jgi:hypothetical protein
MSFRVKKKKKSSPTFNLVNVVVKFVPMSRIPFWFAPYRWQWTCCLIVDKKVYFLWTLLPPVQNVFCKHELADTNAPKKTPVHVPLLCKKYHIQVCWKIKKYLLRQRQLIWQFSETCQTEVVLTKYFLKRSSWDYVEDVWSWGNTSSKVSLYMLTKCS